MSSTAVNKVSATQTVFSESLKGNQKKQIMPECYFQKVEEEKTAKIEEQSNNQKKYIEEIRASATNTKRKAIQSVFLESLKREQQKQRRRARSAQKKEEKKKAKREKRRIYQKKYKEAKINEKRNCAKPYCSDLHCSNDSFFLVDPKKLHESGTMTHLPTDNHEKTNCTKPYCSELYSSGDSFSVVDSKQMHEKKKYERLNTVTIHSCTIPLSVRSNRMKW
jgi:hypothetical protein